MKLVIYICIERTQILASNVLGYSICLQYLPPCLFVCLCLYVCVRLCVCVCVCF